MSVALIRKAYEQAVLTSPSVDEPRVELTIRDVRVLLELVDAVGGIEKVALFGDRFELEEAVRTELLPVYDKLGPERMKK